MNHKHPNAKVVIAVTIIAYGILLLALAASAFGQTDRTLRDAEFARALAASPIERYETTEFSAWFLRGIVDTSAKNTWTLEAESKDDSVVEQVRYIDLDPKEVITSGTRDEILDAVIKHASLHKSVTLGGLPARSSNGLVGDDGHIFLAVAFQNSSRLWSATYVCRVTASTCHQAAANAFWASIQIKTTQEKQ